jgi:hypothetical protein
MTSVNGPVVYGARILISWRKTAGKANGRKRGDLINIIHYFRMYAFTSRYAGLLGMTG